MRNDMSRRPTINVRVNNNQQNAGLRLVSCGNATHGKQESKNAEFDKQKRRI